MGQLARVLLVQAQPVQWARDSGPDPVLKLLIFSSIVIIIVTTFLLKCELAWVFNPSLCQALGRVRPRYNEHAHAQ